MIWRIFLCLLLINLVGCKRSVPTLNGYVEGEYIYLSPTTGGLLHTLSVGRGDLVTAAQPLFTLENTQRQAAVATAEAVHVQAQAKLNNIVKGQRAEEIEVLLKQQEQAKARLEKNKREFQRLQGLFAAGITSQANFDSARSAFEESQGKVNEITATLKVAALGARQDEILAAQSEVEVAQQKLIMANKDLSDAMPTAPKAGRIEDVFFRMGEYVPAGKPVLSMLPPENIKIRFFVPQHLVPQFPLGQEISIACDGCASAIPANVSFVSSQAEYTPPVIYSVESREKLVFMIEARPKEFHPELRPGLPVDIEKRVP